MAKEDKKNIPLFEYGYCGNFETTLNLLKDLAMPEIWEYKRTPNEKALPILFSYLLHTFTRIKEENKIAEKDNYSCFNTGLVTENQQEIFMLFKENPTKGKQFIEFCKESDNNLARFSSLPERASYFNNPADLIIDFRLPIRINIDHIIEDRGNFARFPKYIQSLPKLQLIHTFNGAIDHAQKRVKRNYKTAIPQYYRNTFFPDTPQLQLLLPLCLTDAKTADLALAIYKEGDFYSGRTCLTLDMAINNARLIAKPDDEWLKA